MNEYAFSVIDAINREGIGNEAWGIVEDIDDTKAYFGTISKRTLEGNDTRKKNDTVQVYFDTEKNEWRCFKRLNLETM